MNPSESIHMTVGELTVDPVSKTPIVILRDSEGRLTLPIWIGRAEAEAVASALEGVKVSRPQTHDLLADLLATADIQVMGVGISDLRENTYYAEITARTQGETFTVDARPSDAIALALRTQCEIRVAKHVLEESSMLAQDPENIESQNLSGVEPEKWSEILEEMEPDDFKYKM